jgi:hypothetical protein
MLPRRRSRLGRSILGSDRLCGRWRERPARELPAPPPRYDLTSIFFRLARSAFGTRTVRTPSDRLASMFSASTWAGRPTRCDQPRVFAGDGQPKPRESETASPALPRTGLCQPHDAAVTDMAGAAHPRWNLHRSR